MMKTYTAISRPSLFCFFEDVPLVTVQPLQGVSAVSSTTSCNTFGHDQLSYYYKPYKKIITMLFSIFMFSCARAQEKGIHFEQGNSWKILLAKAKMENKYIFVDCYTTWCGPCKRMSDSIFPMEEVGKFYNKNFINVKLQFDSTTNDADEIKARYADAVFIKTEYKITAYPTYLFFGPNGEILHGSVGSRDIKEFMDLGISAMDPEKQYYALMKKYEAGQHDSSILKSLAYMSTNIADEVSAAKYSKEYIATQANLFSNENLLFLYHTTRNIADPGFDIMVRNLDKLEIIINKEEIHDRFKLMINTGEYKATGGWEMIEKWNKQQWDVFEQKIRQKYPSFAEEVILQFESASYLRKNNWEAYSKSVTDYAHSKSPSLGQLNDCAWAIFSRCPDKKILMKALQWSRQTIAGQIKKGPGYLDTYANILYKLGRKNEALDWEKKAQKIAIEQGGDKNWGQDVIEKIKKNEKTW